MDLSCYIFGRWCTQDTDNHTPESMYIFHIGTPYRQTDTDTDDDTDTDTEVKIFLLS